MFFPLYRSGAHLLLRTARCRSFHFRVGENRLLCWRTGPQRAETWVCLHGLGSSAASWYVLVRALGGECRFVLPELSRLGGSEVPGGALAVRDGVDAVAALIERQSPRRPVVLVGNSLGGWVALRLALERPDLVRRLVLITPGGYREQDWDRIAELIRVGDLGDAEELLDAMFVRPPLPRWFLSHTFRQSFTSPAVTGALEKLSEADALDDRDLARIAAPTALIWGEQDGIFSIEVAEKMAAALPSSVLYRVSSAAHIVQWETPERLIDAVRDFRRRELPAVEAAPTPEAPGPRPEVAE